MLRVLLDSKSVSLYQLEKTSHISHATLNDIYNERSNIDNCSIAVISRIANALNISIDQAYKILTYNDLSLIAYNEQFDLFKSHTLQQLKNIGEASFIETILKDDLINSYFKNKKPLEALYLLSLLDYIMKKNGNPLLKEYDVLRDYKLDKLYVSESVYLLLAMRIITITSVYKESIAEFLKRNIVEANIYDVA